MSLSQIPERVSEALIRATRQRDVHQSLSGLSEPPVPPVRPFSIAMSREAGTPASAIARAVAERLGWQVYDHELLELVARDLNVRAKLLEDMDERHVSWLQECIEAFAAVPSVREGKYVHHLIETMLSLAVRGKCVIVGRGSPFVLPPATTLRVRLVAPLADRIAVVRREQDLSRDDAERFITTTDRDRTQLVRLHFLCDPGEPQRYDLVINTAEFSIAACAELIVDALSSKSRAAAVPASFNPEMALATG